jgi:hypothetical protein
MLTASIVLFMYAALSGLVMAVGIFRGAKRWAPLALGHGVLAATALVLALFVLIATDAAAIKYGVAVRSWRAFPPQLSTAWQTSSLDSPGAACIARRRWGRLSRVRSVALTRRIPL